MDEFFQEYLLHQKRVEFGAFTAPGDIWNILNGGLTGMVAVIPSTSMLKYCQTNVSSISTSAATMVTKFTQATPDYLAGLTSL